MSRSRGDRTYRNHAKNWLLAILAVIAIGFAVLYYNANMSIQRPTTFSPGGDQSSQRAIGGTKRTGTGQ